MKKKLSTIHPYRAVFGPDRSISVKGFITRHSNQALQLKNLPYLIILVVAWGLKAHYSRADSSELVWILWPVAQLTALIGDFSFQYEKAVGYVDYTRRIIIAPGCAGVNFLIVSFCLAGFEFTSYSQKWINRMGWVMIAAVCAFLVTLCANTIRIVGAVFLYQADIYGLVVTPERAHRVFGMMVYLGMLCGLHFLISSWKTPMVRRENSSFSPVRFRRPIFWYLAVAVAVPIINGMRMTPFDPLKEHNITMIVGSLIVLGGANLIHRVYTSLTGCQTR